MASEEAIYRSADMTYVQLYIPLEISKEVVTLLGNLGNIMFKDLNQELTAFQRGYVNQIRKYEEIERLVFYLKEVSEKHADAVWKYVLHVDDEGNEIQQANMAQLISSMKMDSQDSINSAVDDLTLFESRVRQLNDYLEEQQVKLNDLIEQRHVFFECSRFLEVNPGLAGRLSRDRREHREHMDVDDFRLTPDDISETLSDFSFDDGENDGVINAEPQLQSDNTPDILEQGYHGKFMIAGSIRRTQIIILNRILWRLLRGNLFFENFPIDEPLLEGNEKVEKDCFIVFAHGDTIIKKIKRVIESLNGKIFPLDQGAHTIHDLNDKISDLQQILGTTEQTLLTELLVVQDQLPMWHALVRREQYIYATLDLFKQESQGLVAEGWVPSSDITLVSNALKDHSESIGSESSPVMSVILTNKLPPTYYKTNKFTQAFQSIVDAYGIATYKEINPGLATITTFPFMFAIMFGDTGHGSILFLIGLVLVLNERKFGAMQRGEIFDMAFTGRYVVLLMGFFSIYTGLMYNDIFSKSMSLFSSGWEWPSTFRKNELIEAKKVGIYAFGIDFAWHGTDNNLIFTNSYKMKLSILMGFIHMTYSYMFSYINYKHNNSRVDIIGNFIPGLIFMQSIFGYLSWAIIFKWTKDWIKDDKAAPGLLNMLINMFLAPGVIDDQLYWGQKYLQQLLLVAALVCVPWLLLYKPLTLRKQHASSLGAYENIEHSALQPQLTGEEEMIVTDFENVAHEEFNFGDVMIHQVIHTIEFCLNCISHTASYLRLWALSLAHAQLSSVLWDMTIANAFSSQNSGSVLSVTKVVCLFAMWFVLTVCILVLMEGTSAMLHALRLHWVEAMSKFFEGEGYAYEPFSFKSLSDQ